MPKTRLEYVLAALMVASAALVVIGIVVFWRAASFEGYITALLVLALALVSFQGSRDLKQFASEKTSKPEPVGEPATETPTMET